MVNDSIQYRYREFFIKEKIFPVTKFQIGGQNKAFLFVKFADDFIDEACPLVMKGKIPPFIEDEKVVFHDFVKEGLVLSIFLSTGEGIDEVVKCKILCFLALLDC